MTQPDRYTLLQQGLTQQKAGNFAAATALFEQVLALNPEQPDALHLLGGLALQQGQPQQALQWVERAVRARSSATYLNTLGVVQLKLGDRRAARTSLSQAVALNPPSGGEAGFNLGRLLAEDGEDRAAVAQYRHLMMAGHIVRAGVPLGLLELRAHNYQEARLAFEAVLGKQIDNIDAIYNLGLVAFAQDCLDESVDLLSKALKVKPDLAPAWSYLGAILARRRRHKEALTAFQHAVRLDPNNGDAHHNCGNNLYALERYQAAISAYQQALSLRADAETLNNLGSSQRVVLMIEQAADSFAAALERMPTHWGALSNRLMTLNYLPDLAPSDLLAEHQAAASRLPGNPGPVIIRRRGTRLRVGLVSPDFRRHSVAFFVEPLLRHCPANMALLAYAQQAEPADRVTAHLRGLAAEWCEIQGLDDSAAAARIRADGVDVLVDLAGHSANNRLGLFRHRPAPLQATWLGYPHSTGLPEMDVRLVDAWTDPIGAEAYSSERLVRLDPVFLCYAPPLDAPAVQPLRPSQPVTFVSFNAISKLSQPTIRLWSEILLAVPHAILMLKDRALGEIATQGFLQAKFAAYGVGPERLRLHGVKANLYDHLDLYNQADIGLDPFPYAGTTTTCEALWMGVPVITLAGQVHAARVGVSLLQTIGLGGLVARDEQHYVALAVALAADAERRKALRMGLRARLQQSPLLDGVGFARGFRGGLDSALQAAEAGTVSSAK